MAKSDKITVARRIHDVLRLILAGAEFADIRHYASEHAWNVSQRQVRRYIEAAHRRFAKTTRRDRFQLLGRHLMQRRALYARAFKAGDLKTALQVLRDEAELQGLYPPTKIAPTTPDGCHPYPGPAAPALSRRQRVVRLLAAQAKNDKGEERLLAQVTPYRIFRLPDTMLPIQMLSIMALTYVTEQLEYAVQMVNGMLCDCIDQQDTDAAWDCAARAAAYRFRIGRDAWRQFTEKLGVDGDYLVQGNFTGHFLDEYAEKICDLAPSFEEMQTLAAQKGISSEKMATADSLAKNWWRMFGQICQD